MVAFNRTIQTIQEQLRGFSPTAKLLVGALALILVLSLVVVALATGRSELVPLGLSATAGPEAKTRAVSYLDANSIAWDERGGQLLVPAGRRSTILAQLTEQNVISVDQIDFESVLKDDNPFTDRFTRRARLLVAKMNEVARMIGAMSGIDEASVVIDQPERDGGIGSARIEPTASVTVQTSREPLTQSQADAIARMVAGAHAPLKIVNVTVVDARTGRAMVARSDDEMPPTRYLELQHATEKVVKHRIASMLTHIPNVVVAVNTQVDATEVVAQTKRFDDPKSAVRDEQRSERTSRTQATSREPGVRINTGASIQGTGGRTMDQAETKESSKLEPRFGGTEESIRDTRGYAVKINASVLVPRSWIVALYREQQGSAADEASDPDPAALDALVQLKTQEIKELIEPLVDTGTVKGAEKGTIVVSMYSDTAPMATGVMANMAGGAGILTGGGIAGEGIVRSISLGGLAIVSLAFMFMMVKRASRQEELPSPEELVGIPPALAETDEDVVGEAEETAAAMEGVELDESSVRRQQMLDQINELAHNSSDEAATLLRRWIKTDD